MNQPTKKRTYTNKSSHLESETSIKAQSSKNTCKHTQCMILNDVISIFRTQGHIGSGQFGSVQRGVWKTGNGPEVQIALKSLSESSTAESRLKFLQEAVIMAQFKHPNITSLYGVVSKDTPVIYAVTVH